VRRSLFRLLRFRFRLRFGFRLVLRFGFLFFLNLVLGAGGTDPRPTGEIGRALHHHLDHGLDVAVDRRLGS
jgi:hypothetical protein